MHLFVTYMDTQLLPMPNKPDVKPFSGNYYIKSSDKMPELSSNTLAIHQFSEKPPHYRVIVGKEIFEIVKVSELFLIYKLLVPTLLFVRYHQKLFFQLFYYQHVLYLLILKLSGIIISSFVKNTSLLIKLKCYL